MPPDVVGFSSVVKPRHQRAVVSGADLAMVIADLFNKRAGLPAPHPCGGHGDPIDRAALDRDIATDGLEAPATKNLASARYMIEIRPGVGVSVLIWLVDIFYEGRAGHTQLCVLRKPSEQELEVVRGERNVCVQIPDQVKPQMFESLVARIEGVRLGGKLSIAPFRHAHEFDPVKIGCI